MRIEDSIVERFLKEPQVQNMSVKLQFKTKKWHISDEQCGAACEKGPRYNMPHNTLVRNLSLDKVCAVCLHEEFGVSIHRGLFQVVTAEYLMELALESDKEMSWRRVEELNKMLLDSLDLMRTFSVGFYEKRAEAVLSNADTARKTLAEYSKCDAARAQIKKGIENDLLPKAWQGVVELREEQMLIGIAGMSASQNYFLLLRQVLESYSVRNAGALVVLSAPAYVFDYLHYLRGMSALSGDGVLIVGANAPVDPAVAETATELWDPYTPGPFMDLSATIKSACTV